MKAIVPVLVFLLLFAPALRLLRLALATRRAPETWAGLYFLGSSIGLPLRVLGHALEPTDLVLSTQLNFVGHVFFGAASIAMTFFTWRAFRPEAGWARGLAIGMVFAISLTSAYTLGIDGALLENSTSVALANFSRVLPIGWAFVEAFRYWLAMRKRTVLGLADPLVTNRFLLWSIWTGALAALPASVLLLRLLARLAVLLGLGQAEIDALVETRANALIQIVFLLVAPLGALALSLSFFPPARYIAFIERSRPTDERESARQSPA